MSSKNGKREVVRETEFIRVPMRCEGCGSVDTELIVFVGKDGSVYMKVECQAHGGHSHMIRRGVVHIAVEQMLERKRGKIGKVELD